MEQGKMACNLRLLSVSQDSVTGPLNPCHNCMVLSAGQTTGERSATWDVVTQISWKNIKCPFPNFNEHAGISKKASVVYVIKDMKIVKLSDVSIFVSVELSFVNFEM